MNIKKIRGGIKKFLFFIPFTSYFLLFAFCAFLGFEWLNVKSKIPDSAFKDVFHLLLLIALYFCLIILTIGLFSSLLSYIIFRIRLRNGKVDFSIATPSPNDQNPGTKLAVKVSASPILKPAMGFIRLRLKYDNISFSEKVSLLTPASKKIFDQNLDGIFYWKIPQIREYKIDKAVVYFEDLFQFFSFAVTVNVNDSFHTPPELQPLEEIRASPRKTEETKVRIEELKRVEGEIINYKDFESHDDVRRIVWKIYAKNKELVVRIPEIVDPYASHIYFYASFFNSFTDLGSNIIDIPFLNYYKTLCWSVYNKLVQKGFDVRYIPDQEIARSVQSSAAEQAQYALTVSGWQKNKTLKEYFNRRETSVIVISSLSDPGEVEDLLNEFGNEISVIFIELSSCLEHDRVKEWLKWVFIEEDKNTAASYRNAWSLSPYRAMIQQNERKLLKLVRQYERSKVINNEA
jgi:hypothetical protein